MSNITVIGGTGYAGSAIVAEAARRGHNVTSLSTSGGEAPAPSVTTVAGDATDPATLKSVIDGADVVVAALAPRGPLADNFRDVYRTVAQLTDAAGARLFVVGGYSSLRPAPNADRFVADVSDVPEDLRHEVVTVSDVVTDDLPATPASLDWVFVSPPLGFGAHAPAEPLGRYELGDEVAVEPETGGTIAAADYALGVLDLIEADDHHRTQVNLGNA